VPSEPPTILIARSAELQPLLEALREAPHVALDTEFHAERRYYPELYLLQFAFEDGRSFVVDPQNVEIGPLGSALSDANCIVHAGQQDFGILWRECEAQPSGIFDVQIAAGMLGHGYPTRLSTLVSATLDVPLPESATLSDWSVRPLSRKQVTYAITDVKVLIPLHQTFCEALSESGRIEWAKEASREVAEQARKPAGPDHRWAHWEIASQMGAETAGVLTHLCTWRDQKGRDKNQPPIYMLSDGLALDIARRKPRSLDSLAANRRIPQGLIRKFGREIVSVVQDAIDHPPTLPFIPSPDQLARAKSLELWAVAEGIRIGVAPNLLLPSSLTFKVLVDGMAAVDGWRTAAAGDSLAAFLAGQTSLRLTPQGPVVV
jgi:ribonuclease D